MPATYYPAVIDRSSDGFGVSFPDFPGCVAAGATVTKAALNAEAALALHIEGMAKDRDPLPEPSQLDDIEEVEGADDVARVLIRAEAPPKVERVLISLDSGLLRAIDAVAANRSAWIAEAARAKLAGEPLRGIERQEELCRWLSETILQDALRAGAPDSEPTHQPINAFASHMVLQTLGTKRLAMPSPPRMPVQKPKMAK
jgi:predicted RNase H-like HicB family nuclease